MALLVTENGDMAVAGRGKAQGLAHCHLGSGGTPEVGPSHHIRDPKGELIDGRGQVVGHHSIGPPEHHIPHIPCPIELAGGAPTLLPADGTLSQLQAPTGPTPLVLAPEGGLGPAMAWVDRQSSVGS